jgi:hypothetical protein
MTAHKRKRLNERRLERKLADLIDRVLSRRSGGWAETFEQAGVLTGNRGVVLLCRQRPGVSAHDRREHAPLKPKRPPGRRPAVVRRA